MTPRSVAAQARTLQHLVPYIASYRGAATDEITHHGDPMCSDPMRL